MFRPIMNFRNVTRLYGVIKVIWIVVTLQGLEDAQFKGFMVRANRVSGDTEEIVGEWVDLPDIANPRYWYPQESQQTVSNSTVKQLNDSLIVDII